MFERFVRENMIFDDEQANLFLSKFVRKEYSKRDYILQAGDVENYMYFISEGITRFFVYRGEKEITYLFAFPGNFSTSYESFRKRTPSRIYHECITNVTLHAISAKDLNALITSSPAMNAAIVPFLEKLIFDIFEHQIDLLAYSAKEYYQMFVQRNAEHVNRIPLRLLATFLGITPEALSRIRKKP